MEDDHGRYKALGLRLYKDTPLITYIYLKQHTNKEGGAEVPNTLFAAGLPLGMDQDSLRAVFSCFGEVSQVVLHHTKASDRRPLLPRRHGATGVQPPHGHQSDMP